MSSREENSNSISEQENRQDWNEEHISSSDNNQPEENEQEQMQNFNESDGDDQGGNENDADHIQLPFIIESYNREERQRDRTNKPKLGLKRLTEDKKLVSVDIDIPIDENTVIKDKFDWDLSKDKISPTDFSKELTISLKLPIEYAEKIKEQILSQIMEHIKTNTCQKQEEREIFANEDPAAMNKNTFNNMRFNYVEYPEDDLMEKEENERKMLSRRRIKEIKKAPTYLPNQPSRYFKEKKMCRNCKNENNAPGFECKNCKLPFELMEMLNFDDKRVKISAKYYEKIANKIPLLTYEAKKKNFEKEDFDSFYAIYNKIKGLFEQSDELSKENLNQVKYIMEKYHEYFLNGNLDFNDEDIIYDKEMKKGEKKEEEVKPRRARGRPRKIKIINDDLIVNSNQNSEEDPEGSSDSSDEDSSS